MLPTAFPVTRKRHIIITATVVFILTIFMAVVIHKSRHTHVPEKESTIILQRLDEVNTKLHLAIQDSARQQQTELDTMQQAVSHLQNSLSDVVTTSDIKKFSDQMITVRERVDSQINDINKTVSDAIGNKKYLPESTLPFQVISVDVIDEQPYVSVNYQNHVAPLVPGNTLAGWKVTSTNYRAGIAEFVNDSNQYVKTSPHRIAQ